MDIQQSPQAKPVSLVSAQLLKLICGREFTLKKALILSNKYPSKDILFGELNQMYQKMSEVPYLVNLLTIVQHFLVLEGDSNTRNDGKIEWLIKKINEIRDQIDNNKQINEESMQVLNKILKIMNNLVIFIGKISSKVTSKFEESSLFQRQMAFIISIFADKTHNHLFNYLFDINLLVKMLENRIISIQFASFVHQSILNEFRNAQKHYQNCNQIVKEILLNTLIKCLNAVKNFEDYLKEKIEFFLHLFETKSKLTLLVQLKSVNTDYIKFIICETQEQFELLSQVIHQCSQSTSSDLSLLSEIWINNLYSLIMNEVQIDLSSITAELDDGFLLAVYTKVSQLLSTDLSTSVNKNFVICVWVKLLLNEKIYQIVIQNKNVTINVQILLYQFVREILGLLNPTFSPQPYHSILKVFSRYYGSILKQKQCVEINKQIILLVINQHPELLTENMIAKSHTECLNISQINLDDYHAIYIEQLVKKCLINNQLIISLNFLEKRISKIFLKYLIEKNIMPLTTIFNQNDIIAYTIQNDIELHLDIYEHLLQQKIYNNIEAYLSLVTKSHSKNRYRNMINLCFVNLLMNEIQDNPNRKLLAINQRIINLLIENLKPMFSLSIQHEIEPRNFFDALFSFITRSLYYNFPLVVNYLLMICLALKIANLGLEIHQTEIKLASELVKFCRMYHGTQNSYFLSGFASLMLLLYGLPCQTHQLIRKVELLEILETNSFLLQPVIQILSGNPQIIDSLKRRESQLENEHLLEIAFKKCMNVGFIRHLTYVVKNASYLHSQICSFNNIIEEMMINQVSKTTKSTERSHPFDRTRRSDWAENQQQNVIIKMQQRESSDFSFLEHILKQFEQYDEFEEYKHLQKELISIHTPTTRQNQRLLLSSRVHGKIRTILHVNK